MRAELYERAGLTEKQRQVVDLYDAGKGFRTISALLGISKTAARERFAAAEAKIAKLRAGA